MGAVSPLDQLKQEPHISLINSPDFTSNSCFSFYPTCVLRGHQVAMSHWQLALSSVIRLEGKLGIRITWEL